VNEKDENAITNPTAKKIEAKRRKDREEITHYVELRG